MSIVNDVLAGLDTTSAWQEAFYKRLHEHPELSFEETQTRAEVSRRLQSFGYEVREIGGGVVGVLSNGAGRTVLARADMDALPVTEQTGLPYASKVAGVMHACGHDTHITCGLGAAELFAQARAAWNGTFIALFQPAEELGRGAKAMVDSGLLDKVPKPDVCLSQHVLTTPKAGHVATTDGPVLSAGDSLRITVFGKGSHGSMPHLGIDPVVLASAIVLRLQTIVARELAPGDFGVVTVGSVQAGSKANVIPDRAVLLVNVRTYDEDVRARILAAIKRIVTGECQTAGSPQAPELDHYESFPLTTNDPAANRIVTDAFNRHFGPERVHGTEAIVAAALAFLAEE